jgi:hypothetical protein
LAYASVFLTLGLLFLVQGGAREPTAAVAAGPHGDTDCSGAISARDNQALLRFALDQEPLSQTEPCTDVGVDGWGDWDCDGGIGTRDGQALLRFVLGQPALSQSEPCPDIGDETAPPATTYDLIEDAVEAGTISEGTGLLLKAYAAFGDSRLPAEYAGESIADLPAPREIWERPEGLSPEEEDALVPYLLPPPAAGSWYSLAQQAVSRTQGVPGGDWRPVAAGPAKVWWDAARPDDEAKAKAIATEVIARWQDLKDAFDLQPPSDQHLDQVGGDGLYDIYLAPMDSFAYIGFFVPGEETAKPCLGMASYAGLNSEVDTQELVDNVGPILAEGFLVGASFADGCSARDWIVNALSVWALEYTDTEDEYISGLDYLKYFLFFRNSMPAWGDEGRGTWLFFLHLTQMHGADMIGYILANAAVQPIFAAIDSAIPGGFAEVFPEFALSGWNRDQWDRFYDWNEITDSPVPLFANDVSLEGGGETFWTTNLAPLAVDYVQYSVAGGDVAAMRIADPYPANPNISFQILVYYTNGTERHFELPKGKSLPFCQGSTAIDKIVVIAANASWESVPAAALPASANAFITAQPACAGGDWTGEAHMVFVDHFGPPENPKALYYTIDATDLVFAKKDPPLIGTEQFVAVAGTVHYRIHGDQSVLCTMSGELTLNAADMYSIINLHTHNNTWNGQGGDTGFEIPVTVDCPDGDHEDTISALQWWKSGNQPLDNPVVLEGTYEEQNVRGVITYTWSFTRGD